MAAIRFIAKENFQVKLFKKLLHNYSDKLLNHFTVITKEKIRFVSMEDIK